MTTIFPVYTNTLDHNASTFYTREKKMKTTKPLTHRVTAIASTREYQPLTSRFIVCKQACILFNKL